MIATQKLGRLCRLAGFFALLSGLSHAGPMQTAGQFEVSPAGAATYAIPLQVPPGTAGIEPKLSLIYNSQSGNGLLGMGWSLGGLSAISRCPQTVAQDGAKGGVNFDAGDRYCLDGQRLVAVGGAYGADGTEYRTERDTFSKVVSYGTAGNGPAWFKVWTKAGQIVEYGNTADSGVEAQGKTSMAVWTVNKISDTAGNYLTVTYTEDNPNGQYYPSRIDYTGNAAAGTSAYNSVQFNYAARTDVVPTYQAGSLVKSTVLLSGIKVYSGTTLLRDYTLGYAVSNLTTRSRLASLTECMGDGTCLPVTAFGFTPTANGISYQGGLATNVESSKKFQSYFVDLNGDGKADLVQVPNSGSGTVSAYVWLSNGHGFDWAGAWATNLNPTGTYSTHFADLNGDGKADLIQIPTSDGGVVSAYVWLSSGSALVPTGNWATNLSPPNTYSTYFIDLNGDGKADLVQIPKAGSGVVSAYVWISSGSSLVPTGNWASNLNSTDTYSTYFADFNGDGKTDLVQIPNSASGVVAAYVWLSSGSVLTPIGNWATNLSSPNTHSTYFVELNGDGKADLIQIPKSASGVVSGYVWLSSGANLVPIGNWVNNLSSTDTFSTYFVDLNGDGKADIVQIPVSASGTVSAYVWLTNGHGIDWIGAWANNLNSTSSFSTYFADLNGDGKADLIQIPITDTSPTTAYVWQTDVRSVDSLATISTGLSATSSITYKPLTDGSVYTKGSGAVYPIMDLQAPIYVAASVAGSNGVGGAITTNYTYGGAKVDLSGRGFLGFRWMQATNTATGLSARTEYRQDWPYTGLPSLIKKTLPGSGNAGLLSQASHTYGCTNPQNGAACTIAIGNRYFPYISQSVESGWDLNGAALPVVTTANQFDTYGNATQITVSTNDGHGKTTTNTYTNDATRWHLGRLLRSQVQSVAP